MKLIVDLDGTLADASQRQQYADADDWDMFFNEELLLEDKPIEHTRESMKELINMSSDVYFLTGRPEKTRDATVLWLEEHYGINPEAKLFMRKDEDTRSSAPVKEEIIKENFADMNDLVFIDDEDKNLKMFSQYGLALRAPDVWELFV